MARYEYKCTSCGNVFEVEHPMSETPEVVCPSCGAPASKTFSASGIKFDGSGFYNSAVAGPAPAPQAVAAPTAHITTSDKRSRHPGFLMSCGEIVPESALSTAKQDPFHCNFSLDGISG